MDTGAIGGIQRVTMAIGGMHRNTQALGVCLHILEVIFAKVRTLTYDVT